MTTKRIDPYQPVNNLDPNFTPDMVQLLMHCDVFPFVDSSLYGVPLSPAGAMSANTSVYQWPPASAQFNGVNWDIKILNTPAGFNPVGQDFCFEAFVAPTGANPGDVSIWYGPAFILATVGNKLRCYIYDDTNTIVITFPEVTFSPAAGVFHYVAVRRYGDTFWFNVNDDIVEEATYSGDVLSYGILSPTQIGFPFGFWGAFDGQMDELRWVVGSPVYITPELTIPTGPFANP